VLEATEGVSRAAVAGVDKARLQAGLSVRALDRTAARVPESAITRFFRRLRGAPGATGPPDVRPETVRREETPEWGFAGDAIVADAPAEQTVGEATHLSRTAGAAASYVQAHMAERRAERTGANDTAMTDTDFAQIAS